MTKKLIFSTFLSIFLLFSCSDDFVTKMEAQKFLNAEGGSVEIQESRAYKGHSASSDLDAVAFVTAFPDKKGSRLDDCQLCHTGGDVMEEGEDEALTLDQCSFCHTLALKDIEWQNVVSGAPANYYETLNPYGKAYANNRTAPSSKNTKDTIYSYAYTLKYVIGEMDSDNDKSNNNAEINADTYPGDKDSNQNQAAPKIIELDETKITKYISEHSHRQLMLMNANKQAGDEYVEYEGIKLVDLFNELENDGLLDLEGYQSITIYAADGFPATFSRDQIEKTFDGSLWYGGLGIGGTLGANGFVTYPDERIYSSYNVQEEQNIPGGLFLMLAYKRDGAKSLETGSLNAANGKLNGEGPYRVLLPQEKVGRPDRGSKSPKFDDGFDYGGKDLDHNAGRCPKSIVAIKIEPMPEDQGEFDWKYGGYKYLDEKKIFIYGHGVK
ncbi:MAG: hypothetical protein JXR63_06865 [Spirochaetales bacterium]|nr:hypothetical protein [Spirochaetales bacterium]